MDEINNMDIMLDATKMDETTEPYTYIGKIMLDLETKIDKNAINLIKQNPMYNGAYLYTLNRYRNLLLNEVKQYNSSLDMTKSNASSNTIPIETKDVDLYLLKMMKEHYFPGLIKTCNGIANIPLIEQKTPEWFKHRETMISASDAGYFLNKCGMSRAISSLKIKVGVSSYVSSSAPPLMHGNTYEDVSRAIYESRNSVSVTEYGILRSPTDCIGASPDGIITACHKDTYECKSKYGRLLEIKNPYSREIDTTVKPEYMVQILQQQYTTQIPICDFVETTIVDINCHSYSSNNKPYTSLDEMLADKLDMSNPNWVKRIKNKNIPKENINKFGNEKGLVIWYKKRFSDVDIRHKYVLYPLDASYDKNSIEKWIVDMNGENFKDGFMFITTKFWRLDVYSEKTVVYDANIFEGEYVPKLCKAWDVICKCKDIGLKNGNIVEYIEELEKNSESVFYNPNKRAPKAKKQKITNSDLNTYNPTNSIELDF